ncbi:hypothetical protein J1614_004908 [Plenodomus biglobosus]|nr:hypothetical protein J1614_004908 [Plenodomus biglobosus]
MAGGEEIVDKTGVVDDNGSGVALEGVVDEVETALVPAAEVAELEGAERLPNDGAAIMELRGIGRVKIRVRVEGVATMEDTGTGIMLLTELCCAGTVGDTVELATNDTLTLVEAVWERDADALDVDTGSGITWVEVPRLPVPGNIVEEPRPVKVSGIGYRTINEVG